MKNNEPNESNDTFGAPVNVSQYANKQSKLDLKAIISIVEDFRRKS